MQFKNKNPRIPKRMQGQFLQTVIPLCFTLSSRREPHKVPTHPGEITVATGKAYTANGLQPAAHRRNSPLNALLPHTNRQLSETHQTRVLISAQTL